MTTRMPAAKVLDAQADLLRKFKDDDFKVFTAQFFLATAVGDRLSPFTSRPARIEKAVDLAARTEQMVQAAEAYHVSADMTKVIQHAAEGLDESDVTNSALAPSACGIVRFDGGLRIMAGEDETWVDWILWRADVTGFTYILVMDTVDRPDEALVTAQATAYSPKVFGRWRWVQVVRRPNGDPIGEPVEKEYVSVGKDQYESEERPTTNTVRLLHAFWLMIDQQITMVSTERPHPTARPALKKARLPKDVKVTVVELRKHRYTKQPEEAAGGAVEWSHRWIVRGFWRWQAHGEGRKQRKRLWINDFVKGPDDKPLVVKNRVYDVRR